MKNNRIGLVSVIVPIYNSALYLDELLNSIEKQSYTDLEIILVDDGSIDDSLKICKKHQMIDDRIKVIHQENAGQNSARNTGLKYAEGDYIAFVDSDDILLLDYISNLIGPMIDDEEIDICVGGAKTKYNSQLCDIYPKTGQLSGYIGLLCFQEEIFNADYFSWTLWGKLFKRELFLNNITDFKHKNAEDLLLLWNLLKKVKKVYVIPNSDYIQTIRNDSVTSQKDDRFYMDALDVFREIYDIPYEAKKSIKLITAFSERVVHIYMNWLKKGLWDEKLSKKSKCLDYYDYVVPFFKIYVEQQSDEINKEYKKRYLEGTNSLLECYNSMYEKIKNCSNEKKLWLYGAGRVAEDMSDILLDKNIFYCGYIVGNKRYEYETLKNKPVLFLGDFSFHEKKTVLIATNYKTAEKIYGKIENLEMILI